MPTKEVRTCDLCKSIKECTRTVHPLCGEGVRIVWYCERCMAQIFSLWIGDDKE